METKLKKLSFYYACLQCFYWASFCTIVYTQTFLLGRGFSNSQIGIGLAVSSLAIFAVSNFFGYAVDKWNRISAFTLITASVLAIVICAGILIGFKTNGLFAAILFFTCNVACQAVNAMYTKLFVDANHNGANINYARARRTGSVSYALIAIVFGWAIEKFGSDVIPVIGLILCLIQYVFAYFSHRIISDFVVRDGRAEKKKTGKGYPEFIRANRRYAFLLLGIAIVLPAYGAMNNFMLSIVQSVGGDATTLGYISAYSAIIEILAMVYYGRKKNKNISTLLRISLIFYPFKIFFTAIAPNIPLLFLAVSLQVVTYGLYTPAIIEYVNKVVPYEDSAKAQTLSASISCLGSFVVSMFSGYLFDSMTPRNVLFILTAIGFAGVAVCLFGIQNTGREGAAKEA